MSFVSNLLRHLAREEKGNIFVDASMVLPMFIWAHAGLFAYWDAYRSINTVQKGAYTISNLISRSQGTVNDTYIVGMRTVMNTMLDADQVGWRLRQSSGSRGSLCPSRCLRAGTWGDRTVHRAAAALFAKAVPFKL